MSSPRCLLIDDVDAALARLSTIGRSVLIDGAQAVRAAVRDYARRRGWTVITHESYVAWIRNLFQNLPPTRLVLDPLFPIRDDEISLKTVRLSRRANQAQIIHVSVPADLLPSGSDLCIVDDVASSGRTVCYLANYIMQTGSRVTHVAVCASSREARNNAARAMRNVLWYDYAPGDWRAIHMRDGCPHLPFSGRPVGKSIPLEGCEIQMRVMPNTIAGNLWQVLWLDQPIRDAVNLARQNAVRGLSSALGRPALVADLALLGTQAGAVISNGREPTQDTRLDALLD
jgi:hypothetical protein